jgi:hypothetical protein
LPSVTSPSLIILQEQRSSETTTKKKADKPSETAVTLPELRKVKEKLTCALHPGKNRWCYVRGPKDKRPGEHVPLDLEVLLLWARHMVRYLVYYSAVQY